MESTIISSDIFEGQFPINCLYDPVGYNGRPALVGTPGLIEFADTGYGTPVRGAMKFRGYGYWVVGNKVFQVSWSGVKTELTGTLSTSTGSVDMIISGTHLMIVDGSYGYYVAYDALTTVTKITDTSFPTTPKSCTFVGSRFVVADGTNFLYGSSVNTPVSWDATFFISPDAIPGGVISVVEDHNELLVFGDNKVRFYYASESDFTYEQNQSAVMEEGCGAVNSVGRFDSSVVWLAEDRTIRRVTEYTPLVISPPELSDIISKYTTVSDAVSFSFSLKGMPYLCMAFPTEQKTWLYNGLSQQWCIWAYSAAMVRHRANCSIEHNGVVYIGDYQNGKIYKLSDTTYTDDGEVIRFERTSPIVQEENKRFKLRKLQLDWKQGIGLATGQGSDPQCMLRYSKTGTKTWSNETLLSMGKIGEYSNRTIKRNFGVARKLNFKIAVTDPVERCLFGAYMET